MGQITSRPDPPKPTQARFGGFWRNLPTLHFTALHLPLLNAGITIPPALPRLQSIVGYQAYELRDNFNFTIPTFETVSGADLTLGDIKPDFSYGNSSIQLLDDGGACAKVEIDGLGEVDAQYYYLDAETAAAMEVAAGWYLVDDMSFEFCQNALTIPAGQAFLLDCQDSGAKVSFPSAL